MSKKGAASRWNGGRMRYTEAQLEDARFVRNAKGQLRLKEDEPTEHDWIERRKEKSGFRKGARVTR